MPPYQALQQCAERGCSELVIRGRCAAHARFADRDRRPASARGYGYRWEQFRPRFIDLLCQAGVLPVCGASLPTGPQTRDSVCKQRGLLNRTSLHLDHEPPLQEWERHDPRIVCDPNRIQLLCQADHNAKTLREGGAPRGAATVSRPHLGMRWIVTGPPGSGKTTWVDQHRQPGDVVWDLDVVGLVLSQQAAYPRSPAVYALLISLRESLVQYLERHPNITAYLIVMDEQDAMKYAKRLNAQVQRCQHVSRPQQPVGGAF